jgi:pyrimidine operon attenuation protein/uracil phosphoribosyltransferase
MGSMTVQRKRIMSAEDIERSLTRIALQIIERNRGVGNIAIIGIYTGGVYLANRIQKIIEAKEKIDVPAGSLDITLYRDDWSLAAQNPVVKRTDIDFAVEGKSIILIDDVIFTGRTIRAAMDALMDFGRPLSIQLAVLVDRGSRELPIQPDYTGLEVAVNANQHVHVLLKETADFDEVVLETHQ